MATYSKILTNTFVLAALLTDYLVLFDYWIITPPLSPTGPATPQRKRWLAGLKTTVCYAVTQPLWAWAVAATSADGAFWTLMASYAAIVSVLGALAIFDAGLQAIVKDHNEHCLSLENIIGGSDSNSEKTAKLDSSPVERDGINGPETEKASLPSRPQQQPLRCTRHVLPPSYYLAIMLPALTAAAADSALLFFARFLTSKDSMDWIIGTVPGWNIYSSVAAFSYAGSKVMNWMPASFANRGPLPMRSRSWRAYSTFMAEKAALLLILLLLRGTLRILLGQRMFLGASWDANNGTIQLIGPLLSHENALQPATTEKILGINWYVPPSWLNWPATGIVAVCQVWWFVSGPFRRNREVREETFSVGGG